MSLKDLSDAEAIYRAVAEFDVLTRPVFLEKYGFGQSREYFLIVDGKAYDSKAVLGAAHGFQFPDRGPLRPEDFSGGEKTVVPRLRALGFSVHRDRQNVETQPIVLVENEVTVGGAYDAWEDVTGSLYHFPNQYRNKVKEGRLFVYYRGLRKADGTRRPTPEYFGVGRIGRVWRDSKVSEDTRKQHWHFYADLLAYSPFPNAVSWKDENDQPYESIPRNLYQNGVREISPERFAAILAAAGVADTNRAPVEDVPPVMPPFSDVTPVLLENGSLLVVRKVKPGPAGTSGGGSVRRSRYAHAVGRRAEEVVFRHLQATLSPEELISLRWLSNEGEKPGWDIQFTQRSGELKRIEVKGTTTTKFVNIEVTEQEWTAARELRSGYWLFLVASCAGNRPQIQALQDPYALYDRGQMTAVPLAWRLDLVSAEPATGKVEAACG